MRREEVVERLLEYSMREYRSSHLFNNLMQIIADELIEEAKERVETKNQFHVDTCTWGIDDWERECSITVNLKKPLDQRKSFVNSKLRSIGATRIAMIKKVAESFEYGEVDVTEDIPKYTVNIKFVGEYGIPPNLIDIRIALRAIIPAHLDINYIFTYVTWNELDNANLPWTEADKLKWTELEAYRKV
ncbi:putative phage tail protein [Bacillus sp. FSL W8-0519]|uniref:putative phage tail protein n=1 Tax=Bacillus sp. FSL W8-0519 TaxID=2954624 RepID=UPI0009373EED